jgi:hypothetical protein
MTFHCTDCGKPVKTRGYQCLACYRKNKNYNRNRSTEHQNDSKHSKLSNQVIKHYKRLNKLNLQEDEDAYVEFEVEKAVFLGRMRMYIDIFVELYTENQENKAYGMTQNIVVEVKPTIYDLGQVLRQIQDQVEAIEKILDKKTHQLLAENDEKSMFTKRRGDDLTKFLLQEVGFAYGVLAVEDNKHNRKTVKENEEYINEASISVLFVNSETGSVDYHEIE